MMPPNEPAPRHPFHRRLAAISDSLAEGFTAVEAQLTRIADRPTGAGEPDVSNVIDFLAHGVARPRFTVEGDHRWVPLLNNAGFRTLAQIAAVDGDVNEAAREIEGKIAQTPVSVRPPTHPELMLLVAIARLVAGEEVPASRPPGRPRRGV
jgi:hypothetical protein